MTNTAPTMSYLKKINKTMSTNCPRCNHSPETLHHVLNNCPVALEKGLYTWRHNRVLDDLYKAATSNFDPPWDVRADLAASAAGDTIPHDVLCTPLKPDLTVIQKESKEIFLVELTICWDTGFQQAQTRKLERYQELVAELEEGGWKSTLITLEVGSRGFTGNRTATSLRKLFPKKKTRASLLTKMNQSALTGSYAIFIQRNNPIWDPV